MNAEVKVLLKDLETNQKFPLKIKIKLPNL